VCRSHFCLQFNHIANTQILLPDPSIFPRTDLVDEFNLAAGRQPHLLEKFSITNSINLLCIFEQTKGAAGAASSLSLALASVRDAFAAVRARAWGRCENSPLRCWWRLVALAGCTRISDQRQLLPPSRRQNKRPFCLGGALS
jgi:hypothetical protein